MNDLSETTHRTERDRFDYFHASRPFAARPFRVFDARVLPLPVDATNSFVDIFPCAYTYLTGEQLSGILDRTLNHDLSFPKATELKFTQSKSTVGSWFNDNRESRYSVLLRSTPRLLRSPW